MTVAVEGDTIRLAGRCRLEEAETLLEALLVAPARAVDMSLCTALHTAVFQILLASRPTIVGEPENLFLAHHVLPLLRDPVASSVTGSPSL